MTERGDAVVAPRVGPGPSGGTASSVSPLGEGLVTAEDVAAYLALDVSSIYRLAGRALPVVVIGRVKRFRVADVHAFVARQTRGTSDGAPHDARPVDPVQRLLGGASRRARPARSNDLEVCAQQSVHGTSKQEPWRPPGLPPKEEQR